MSRLSIARGAGRMWWWTGLVVLGIVAVLIFGAAGGSGASVHPASASSCTAGSEPQNPAYDPVNHEVYVPNFNSRNVTVLKNPCTIAATIKLPKGAYPTAAAFDPLDNDVYVADMALNQVYVLSGTKKIATITDPSFNAPRAIAYDPGDAVMVVANYGGDSVSFINQLNEVAFASPVGDGPIAIDYDPYYATLNVVNYDSNNVTVFDAVSLQLYGSVEVGGAPISIAYDPVDQLDYVANYLSNNVSLLSGVGPAGSMSGFDEPAGVTWSQDHLLMYVTNSGDGDVFEISGTSVSKTVVTASGVWSPVYDDDNNKVYVTNLNTDVISVLS